MANVAFVTNIERQTDAKVFIGNLNSLCTEEAITELCSQFGVVREAKILRKKIGQTPCAFVTFNNLDEATHAIGALNGFQNDLSAAGKALNVRLADIERKDETVPPEAPPVDMNAAQPQIFVGGLPEKCNDFVWGMMAPFGRVTEAFVHNKQSALTIGFARFENLTHAQAAVATIQQLGRYNCKFSDGSDDATKGQQARSENVPQGTWDQAGLPIPQHAPIGGLEFVQVPIIATPWEIIPPTIQPPPAPPLEAKDIGGIPLHIQQFVMRWGLDAASLQMLLQLDPTTLAKVMTEFSPGAYTHDANNLLRGFVISVAGLSGVVHP